MNTLLMFFLFLFSSVFSPASVVLFLWAVAPSSVQASPGMRLKFQIPLRTPQRPQPVVDPNMVCVHFTFWCHECTHFAWISYSAVKSTCLFVVTSEHTLLGPVCHSLCTHTSGARTVLGSTVLVYIYILFQPVFSRGLCSVLFC